MQKLRAAGVLGALVAAAILGAANVAPASAAGTPTHHTTMHVKAVPSSSGPCGQGDFCIYSEKNQSGSKCTYLEILGDATYVNESCSWEADGISALSDSNRTGATVTMYTGENPGQGHRIGSSASGSAGNFTIPWDIGSLTFR